MLQLYRLRLTGGTIRKDPFRIRHSRGWAATALILLAGLHACAALFHHFVLRDRVLRRMLLSSR